MNLYDEWKFNIKKNYIYYFLIIAIVTLFTFLVYNLIYFGFGIKEKQINMEQKYEDKLIYNIFDNLSDPNDFMKYSNTLEGINRASSFYNELNKMKDYSYQTIFTQPLFLTEFKGDRSFDGTPETPLKYKNFYEIKSIQLNKNAFLFNKIHHTGYLNWENIDYSNDTIPILLGFNYKDKYKIGDLLNGSFYLSKKTKFKVSGFIPKNSNVLYDGDIVYLDHYIIIPYPEKIKRLKHKENFEFESAAYFNMLRGNIITSNDNDNADVIDRLNLLKNKTGFDKITIGGHSTLEMKYRPLIKFIDDLKLQVIIYTIFLIALVILVNINLYTPIINSRQTNYYTYNLLGYDNIDIFILKMLDVVTPLIISLLVILFLSTLINFNFLTLIFSIFIMIFCCLFPFYLCLFFKERS